MNRFMRFALVVALFLVSSMMTQAQNVIEINQAASETTSELKSQLKFDAEQQDLIYRSFVLYHKKLNQINTMSAANSKSVLEEKKKIYSELKTNLNNILSREQFAHFLEIENNKN